MLLYAVSGISGVSAILISIGNYIGGTAMFAVAVVVLILNLSYGSDSNGLLRVGKSTEDNESITDKKA